MQSEEFGQFTGLIGQLPSANMSARRYLTWKRYERQKTFVTGSLRDKVDKKYLNSLFRISQNVNHLTKWRRLISVSQCGFPV